jgi:diadenosine tetraphosphatase ApaH/serine/threonine PP2A family protein phosphatase
MLYAVISDLHANLEAVTACFEEIDKIRPDRVICLGDLVDYCAEPNEVIEIVKAKCDVVIIGNHDEAQFNYAMIERYTENAWISSVHTRTVIDPKHIDYFRSLKYTHSENNILFVHASPLRPETYRYVLNTESAAANFESFTEKICFIGHSHRPLLFEQPLTGEILKAAEGKLNPESRYIINVGSVGQPRDGNPKLSFGLFSSDNNEYRNIRVKYDVASASAKIEKEGLPLQLAQRLFPGV